jgi:hypothetical protein
VNGDTQTGAEIDLDGRHLGDADGDRWEIGDADLERRQVGDADLERVEPDLDLGQRRGQLVEADHDSRQRTDDRLDRADAQASAYLYVKIRCHVWDSIAATGR